MSNFHRHPNLIIDDILEAKARFDERFLIGLPPLFSLDADRLKKLQRVYFAWERLIARPLLEELEASERWTANWKRGAA